MQNLVQKYNVPGPRYTSYPTVPYWNEEGFSKKTWLEKLKQSFQEHNTSEGISLYIHLPFCESLCTFCGCNKRITKRHDVEQPYINAVLKEWNLYLQHFDEKPLLKEIHLGGGTPTFFSPEHLKKLLLSIIEKCNLATDYEFSFEGHPNNTTEAHLQVLYDVGFRRVSFGVQDYNFEVQKAINRIQPFENVQKVTEMARRIGYTSVGHDIIFGLPFQTLDHIIHTIEKTKSLMPDRIAFYSYAHVPWIKGNGQRGFSEENLPSPETKRMQYQYGKEALEQIGYQEIGMDHFALKSEALYKASQNGSLHRNFMGYTTTTSKIMIGLGVSSISDSWTAFAQNVKKLEDYYKILADNEIPVYRGHILSREDQIIRKHILNLMCTLHTQWTEEEKNHINFETIKTALAEMQEDGLITVGSESVRIKENGRPFVRNLCMAFDVLLNRKQPQKQLFSMTI
jgi:oxygen-independent coproporphyrinogen-3 oxidase